MEYRFAQCLVRLPTREILLHGQPQETPKKVFDVLAYLIRHRDRVVSRRELFEQIWRGRVVTGNVLSRTVMQAREAIGDTISDQAMIRTVQGVGYRFVAEMTPDDAWRPGPPVTDDSAPSSAVRGVVRLGFLPFANKTGDLKLTWVELGLPSLVVQSLNSDARLAVTSTASVLMCIDSLSGLVSAQEKAHRLMQMLGVRVVVAASISQLGDRYILSFRSFGRGVDDFEAQLADRELTQLGLQLAREVERRLFPADVQGIGPQSDDHFVNECFSRGMAAADARRWSHAARFFAIVCLFEPATFNARLQYAHVLARIPDRAAIECAQALVTEADQLGDPVLQARANCVLAQALVESDVDLARARSAVDRAIGLPSYQIGEEWLLRAYLLKFHLALVEKDYATCEQVSDEAQRVCTSEGHRVAMLMVLNNRGVLQAVLGQVHQAHATMSELLRLSADLGQPSFEVVARSNLVISAFALGLFDQCLQLSDQFVEMCRRLADRPFITFRQAIANVFIGACELRDTGRLTVWRAQLDQSLAPPENPVAEAFDVYREALVEYAEGHLTAACKLLMEAREILDDGKHYHEFSEFMPLLIALLLWLGRLDEAAMERQRLCDFQDFAQDRLIRPAICYLDAMAAWQRGDARGCMEGMKEGLVLPFPSPWQSYMRFDLAWLHLQEDDLGAAHAVLAPVSHWLDRHPAGLVVGALLAGRQGDTRLALRRHERHLELAGGPEKTRFGALVLQPSSVNDARNGKVRPQSSLPSAYLIDS